MTPTSRVVDSGGVRVATRDHGGNGSPLVLMHGAGMDQTSLDGVIAHLPGFRVVTFDFRGHGGTDRAAEWTFDAALRDLEAVVAAYELVDPAVGGHSLGGMVAALYAAEHPMCAGAVNIDGQGLGRVEQYVGCDPAEVRAWWAQHQRRVEALTRSRLFRVVTSVKRLRGTEPTATAEAARQVMHEVDALDLLDLYRRVKAPLLVLNCTKQEDRRAMRLVMGKGAALIGAFRQGLRRDLTALAAEQPTFEVVELDATHMVVRTHPALVAEQITAFLT